MFLLAIPENVTHKKKKKKNTFTRVIPHDDLYVTIVVVTSLCAKTTVHYQWLYLLHVFSSKNLNCQ